MGAADVSSLKIPPDSVQIAPVPFEQQTAELVNRRGGTLPLPVMEATPGVFTSAWVVNQHAMKVLKRRGACLTVVIDTNVPGHPSISIKAQLVKLTDG
jgi:hypothetical protein